MFSVGDDLGGARRGAGRKSAKIEEDANEIYATYKAAQAKKEQHNANLAELEELKARGELVHIDLVKAQASQAAKHIREALLSLPSRLSAILADNPEPIVRERMTKEIRDILEGLSNEI
jgi:phage terminase Nu1 subunit (DNA packaging protein)